MTTRYDIHYNALLDLGQIRHYETTGAGAAGKTTAVCSRFTQFRTDEWKYGTFIHVDDSEIREITAFAPATGTFTFAALTAQTQTGDEFAVAPPEYPYLDMIRIIDRALLGLGVVPLIDTSITTSASKTEYTMPSGVAADQVRKIWVQLATGDADDNEWLEVTDWYPKPGATYDIVFRSQPLETRTLAIQYMGSASALTADTSTISTSVQLERIVPEVVFRALMWRKRNGEKVTDQIIDDLNNAEQALARAIRKYKVFDPGMSFKPLLTNQEVLGQRSKYGPWNPNA